MLKHSLSNNKAHWSSCFMCSSNETTACNNQWIQHKHKIHVTVANTDSRAGIIRSSFINHFLKTCSHFMFGTLKISIEWIWKWLVMQDPLFWFKHYGLEDQIIHVNFILHVLVWEHLPMSICSFLDEKFIQKCYKNDVGGAYAMQCITISLTIK